MPSLYKPCAVCGGDRRITGTCCSLAKYCQPQGKTVLRGKVVSGRVEHPNSFSGLQMCSHSCVMGSREQANKENSHNLHM